MTNYAAFLAQTIKDKTTTSALQYIYIFIYMYIYMWASGLGLAVFGGGFQGTIGADRARRFLHLALLYLAEFRAQGVIMG